MMKRLTMLAEVGPTDLEGYRLGRALLVATGFVKQPPRPEGIYFSTHNTITVTGIRGRGHYRDGTLQIGFGRLQLRC